MKESGDSGRPFPVEAKEDSSVEKLKPGVPEFPIPTSLDPSDEKDYKACVEYWRRHFTFCEDVYELDRGLNVVFTTDWVPDIQVIEDALRAARRLNQFPVAVRIIEALEKHAYNVAMYREYIEKLKPLLEELGVPEKRDLGDFKMTFKRIWWRQ